LRAYLDASVLLPPLIAEPTNEAIARRLDALLITLATAARELSVAVEVREAM
jgi:hypothetical protein